MGKELIWFLEGPCLCFDIVYLTLTVEVSLNRIDNCFMVFFFLKKNKNKGNKEIRKHIPELGGFSLNS